MSTRSYDSSGRRSAAEKTRAAVLEAATRAFAERGWAGTAMKDVARDAGVSVETVYASVGNKVELLKVALDVAVVGDDQPVPLLERPEFTGMAVDDLAHRLAATGRLLGRIHARTAPLRQVLRAAVGSDPGLASLETSIRKNERVSYRAAMELVSGRAVTETEVDGFIAAFGPESYLTLTRDLGWSQEEFENWVADTAGRLLARP